MISARFLPSGARRITRITKNESLRQIQTMTYWPTAHGWAVRSVTRYWLGFRDPPEGRVSLNRIHHFKSFPSIYLAGMGLYRKRSCA